MTALGAKVVISRLYKLGVMFFVVTVMSACTTYPSSTADLNSENIEIKRKKHYFRHWMWSGIFPSGGFIPDPHFYVTDVFDIPEYIESHFKVSNIRFQGVDINPWFEDKTSEIVLAIEVDGNVSEIIIDNSGAQKMRYGFVNFDIPIVPFIYKDKLAFITGLYISNLTILVVDYPGLKSQIIYPIFQGQEKFLDVIKYLREKNKYLALKDGLCGQYYKPYRELYSLLDECPDLSPRYPKKFSHYAK